ncbi:L-lactate permease [Ramlibacter rhizophilus]|uniref:L-lactate permease n=1 Tax=Ramlibacter rhizophilus TaxID=1781167 RepID=A0A4Z0BZR6_9BURK|nr:L-lactate permease [Ramlibacter rhizophilus]TFZ04743.1 L-lactate permease [Ramlibacter rhizophilus]
MALFAASPILLILVLMLLLRWSAARAGLAGCALTAALVLTVFDHDDGGTAVLAGALAEAAFTAATILWILWPALALHQHQQDSGALDRLRSGLAKVSARPALQVLLVGWFAALFMEGAAGFGTPVALAAPLLLSLGVPVVQAVVLALLGHAVGVSFGALGTPVMAQVALTELDAGAIAWRTAALHALTGAVMMAALQRSLASAPEGIGAPPLGWSALAALAFLAPSLAIAALLGPELATLGAALLGGGAFVLLLRTRGASPARPAPAGTAALLPAFWPYAVLVLLVLATRAVPPVAAALGDWTLEWRWLDRFTGRMSPLAHPGTLLFLSLLVGAALQGVPLSRLRAPLAGAARRLVPVSVALLAMLWLSRLMVHAGMIDAIQQAAVRAIGAGWPAVAPAVGALGSFVTGSATASNVLLTTLQAQTAQALGLPAVLMVAAQGFGAAVGNIVCPHNIVAGAATVGLAGRESEILRRTVGPCVAYLIAGGAAVFAWAWMAG